MPNPVFVIEDDEDARAALVEVLTLDGVFAIGMGDAAAVVERFQDGMRPCVIVLDLGLPILSGEEFLRARLLEPELAAAPVLIVTGRDVSSVDFSGLNVVGVLQKPFDPLDVLAAIRPYYDSHQDTARPNEPQS